MASCCPREIYSVPYLVLYFLTLFQSRPICWTGKRILLLTDMGSRDCSPLPHTSGFLFPSQTWKQLVFAQPSDVSSCPCFFSLVFSDPSCRAQGRATGLCSQGQLEQIRYVDLEQLRVRRKAELSTNHTSVESEGKQFASLFFPSCFHLKKEAAQKDSPPQPAKPGGP